VDPSSPPPVDVNQRRRLAPRLFVRQSPARDTDEEEDKVSLSTMPTTSRPSLAMS
jgi:hypothetical protein